MLGCVPRMRGRDAAAHRVDSKSGLDFLRLGAGPLWMMRTDVTVRAYALCSAAGKCNALAQERDEPKDRCNWKHARLDHPMNCVTQPEASAFCDWIDARLPTRDEWTYAALSGDTARIHSADSVHAYPWGREPVTARRANYCDQRCAGALGTDSTDGKNLRRWEAAHLIDHGADDGYASTSPAGNYRDGATAWGLLDMAGNVWQWTSTAGPAQTVQARSRDSNSLTPMTLETFEVRGGSWDNAPASLVAGRRLPWPGRAPDAGMGFRCVSGER